MKVSWNWLKDYVSLDMPMAEVENRLAMSGLNHEETIAAGDDFQIDLEVTSNRSDCNGHIGVAREIAVLWERDLCIPDPAPVEKGASVAKLIDVSIEAPLLCPQYTARVVRGVKVGPSPDWLVNRLQTLGINVINNIVDITNYVLMECGQPLHAFDYAKIGGQKIIVREAIKDEPFLAIDHKEYALSTGMCVIADDTRPVALAGVMGGADTEVGNDTVDVLIEAADFDALSVRTTARKLRLHSDSSYRFERGVDPNGIDWASRRACEIILDLAGGELASGVVNVHPNPRPQNEPVVVRFSQLKRVLGIELDKSKVIDILTRLGLEKQSDDDNQATFVAPSWRKDLGREIDLVEEVARINGYDKIPEDVGVPMAPSHRSNTDRVLGKVRHALTSAGFNEALTLSVTEENLADVFSPWTDRPAIHSGTSMLKGADRLRRSLVASILTARKINESLANEQIQLFETAKVYLPSDGELPEEHRMLALTSGKDDFREVKGVIEQMLSALHSQCELTLADYSHDFFVAGQGAELRLGDMLLGFMGVTSAKAMKACGLRNPSVVAELKLEVLESVANLVPQFSELSPYPAISRDLNFIVSEQVRWADLESTVRSAAGEHLESVQYRETYRDSKSDGADKKRLLFSFVIRSANHTLTGDEADQIHGSIIAACEKTHDAKLVA
ncbi:MAG: phenylalanine--tRNA ligase subunit beta [Planctomycetales bacterium]|nr:phenylalanine--tRNA ligase subunit beta [Planctomycetales bacterium]